MKPYQLAGMNWLCLLHDSDVNGILADEMGLGKTLQTIAFLTYLIEKDTTRINGPHLIIVPASTLENWMRELNFWAPDLKVCCYYGTQEERRYQRKDIMKCAKIQEEQAKGGVIDTNLNDQIDIVLTTYTCSMSATEDRMALRKVKFYYAVFDEGHMLKNMNTNRYQQLMKVNTKRRLLLTGTPVQNSLLELISLLKFVMPSMFDKSYTADALQKIFGSTDVTKQGSNYIKDRVKQAREIMQPFVLRRLKENVLQCLPKKQSVIEQCDMTPYQKEVYNKALEEIRYRMMHGASVAMSSENKNNLMQLRKISTHPSLVRKRFDSYKLQKMAHLLERYGRLDKDARNAKEQCENLELYNDFELNQICKQYSFLSDFVKNEDEISLNSGKFKMLDKILAELKSKEENPKALIFSQFTMLLDVLEVYLNYRGHKYLRMDGTTPVQDRLELIDQYNKDPEIFLFILSTKAGGLGINLTAANTVIIHDLDMNPYNDKQAEDRCHRFGQSREVTIYRLLTKQTVDISIFKRATAKLKLERDMTKRELENNKTNNSSKSPKSTKKSTTTEQSPKKEKEVEINESEIAEMMRNLITQGQKLKLENGDSKNNGQVSLNESTNSDLNRLDSTNDLTSTEIDQIKVGVEKLSLSFVVLRCFAFYLFVCSINFNF